MLNDSADGMCENAVGNGVPPRKSARTIYGIEKDEDHEEKQNTVEDRVCPRDPPDGQNTGNGGKQKGRGVGADSEAKKIAACKSEQEKGKQKEEINESFNLSDELTW